MKEGCVALIAVTGFASSIGAVVGGATSSHPDGAFIGFLAGALFGWMQWVTIAVLVGRAR